MAVCVALTAWPAYSSYRQAALHNWDARWVVNSPVSYSLLHEPFYMETNIVSETYATVRHVSSTTPLGRGRVMAVWYEGSAELARDVTINSSVYDEHSLAWSAPVAVVTSKSATRELGRYVNAVGNAMVYKDSAGRLWMFYAYASFGGWSDCSLAYKVSLDDGISWGASRPLVTSPFLNISTNVKNKPVELDDGSLLVPAYHELIGQHSLVMRVIPLDAGASRVEIGVRKLTRTGRAIQPSLLHGAGRGLTAYMRNMSKGALLVANSADMGQSWSAPVRSPLPNPNSGADVIVRPDGSYLAAINWSDTDRRNLKLALSSDAGQSWRPIKTLEEAATDREYSYPYITRTETGVYHVTYTFERKTIKHVSFNEEWLERMAAKK